MKSQIFSFRYSCFEIFKRILGSKYLERVVIIVCFWKNQSYFGVLMRVKIVFIWLFLSTILLVFLGLLPDLCRYHPWLIIHLQTLLPLLFLCNFFCPFSSQFSPLFPNFSSWVKIDMICRLKQQFLPLEALLKRLSVYLWGNWGQNLWKKISLMLISICLKGDSKCYQLPYLGPLLFDLVANFFTSWNSTVSFGSKLLHFELDPWIF